ncbi:aminoglycoside phosphotransferase family protein [Actinopolymorpha singaporensis]|uniref:Phosphotransferase enzyme family protein n=1 Tax=Actinopolymorpha singaporensis TaxID=117157 RepID=A0A1H1R6E5_9ACTN|nr:aminoglycoside phosphotransferase family protein [Actinopolymorpha singaporensis]SDS31298.1 Phosphotransferase enzyme family protein [Actinopolymorpha singaporensis]
MSLDVVQALNEWAGLGLELVGLIEEGQSGAACVRRPDGRDAIVTTAFASIELMRQTADVLAEVRTHGIPVPLHEFVFDLGDGRVAVVQERLPGSTVTKPDAGTVDAIIAMNERFAGLLANRPEVAPPPLSLGRPGDQIPAELIERHSPRARRLLHAVRRVAGDPDAEVVGDDLVHVDLTVANMLFDATGAISGVIDWNYGVARGDRYFGVVKLLHTLSFAAASPDTDVDCRPTADVVARVEEVLARCLDPDMLRRYWAHQTVNMLYVSRRWGTEEAFTTYLDLGESKLG